MYPRSGFRSGGNIRIIECTLVADFVPGEHPPKPPFWKTTLLATPPPKQLSTACQRLLKSRVWAFGSNLLSAPFSAVAAAIKIYRSPQHREFTLKTLSALIKEIHAFPLWRIQDESPQMWVWPQLPFGGSPPSPPCNWRTLPSSPSPSLSTLPHPLPTLSLC